MNDDTLKGPTRPGDQDPGHQDPFLVLHNALFDVLIEREQIAMSVQQKDAEDAVNSAFQAARSWMSARAALQRLRARETAARELRQHAERAIHASHAALVGHLQCVLPQITDAAPHLPRMMRTLKACLWFTNDEFSLKASGVDPGTVRSDIEDS